MGMYTELIFGCSLKKDTPLEVINILRSMVGVGIDTSDGIEDKKWKRLFNCSSYYFGVSESLKKMWFDDIGDNWIISTRSNIKNYENEIEEFLEWIKPHIESGSGRRNFYAIVTYGEGDPLIYYLNE